MDGPRIPQHSGRWAPIPLALAVGLQELSPMLRGLVALCNALKADGRLAVRWAERSAMLYTILDCADANGMAEAKGRWRDRWQVVAWSSSEGLPVDAIFSTLELNMEIFLYWARWLPKTMCLRRHAAVLLRLCRSNSIRRARSMRRLRPSSSIAGRHGHVDRNNVKLGTEALRECDVCVSGCARLRL